MNDPLAGNQMPTPNQPVQPTGWAPQPQTSAPVASSPFEAQPIPNITGPASAPLDEMSGPVMMEPAKPKSSLWLFIILGVLIVIALVFLAAWLGWLNFGNIFGAKSTPVVSVSPTLTPTVVVNKNDANRKTDLINLKTALQKYYDAKQSYPISTTTSKTSDSNSPLSVLVPDYIASLPLDPLSPNDYYGYKSDGKTFELTAVLEDKTDSSGIMAGNFFLYKVTNASPETPSTSNPVLQAPVTTTTTTTTSTNDSTLVAPPITDQSVGTSSSSSTSTSGSGTDANASTSIVVP